MILDPDGGPLTCQDTARPTNFSLSSLPIAMNVILATRRQTEVRRTSVVKSLAGRRRFLLALRRLELITQRFNLFGT